MRLLRMRMRFFREKIEFERDAGILRVRLRFFPGKVRIFQKGKSGFWEGKLKKNLSYLKRKFLIIVKNKKWIKIMIIINEIKIIFVD